jgi:hypothetical protein
MPPTLDLPENPIIDRDTCQHEPPVLTAPNKRQMVALVRIATANVGTKKGLQAINFLQQWDACAVDLGKEPTVAEYATWCDITERAAYIQLANFRKAYPEGFTRNWAGRKKRVPRPEPVTPRFVLDLLE